MKRRAISILLTLCMALTMLPGTVLAAGEQVQTEEQVMAAEDDGSEEVITENEVEQEEDSEESVSEAVDTETPGIETPDIETPGIEIPDMETSNEETSDEKISLDTEIEEDVPAELSLERLGGVKTIVAEGNCGGVGDGSNVTWTLDSEGVLTISGTGRMANYIAFRSPFFKNLTIKGITILDDVTSIGSNAFEGCRNLTSINIPESVTSIGNSAFSNCMGLESISIPNSVTTIGECAFFQSGLHSIIIPSGVTTIEDDIFASCRGLESIFIPNSVTTIEAGAFAHCDRLTNINIPASVTSIGDGAFSRCSSLANINIPAGVTSIGDSVFFSCYNLTSITLSNNVTSIGTNAFNGCIRLVNIVIPDSVKSIEDYAFAGCNSLTSVILPDGITSIKTKTFVMCSSLTEITVPNSVDTISLAAFDSCDDLVNVYYSGSRTQWNSISIDYDYEQNSAHNNCTGNDALKRARIYCAGDSVPQTYTLTGTITGHKDVAYQSVSANLVGMDGMVYPATVSGGDLLNGTAKKECTYSVSAPAGQYSLEVEAVTTANVTVYRSAVVKLTGNGQTKDINLPNGQAKVNVTKSNGVKAVVGGLDTLVIGNDNKIVDNGTSAEVSMTINKVSNSDSVAVEIQKKASGQTLEDFFDFSIGTKANGATTASSITNTGNATVEIVLPFNSSGKKNVKVYRYHNDQVDTLTEQEADGEKIELINGSITIYAKKFSVYAIGYTVSNDGNSSSGGNSGSGGGSSADSETVKKEPVIGEPIKNDIPVINVSKKPAVSKQQPQQVVKNEPAAQNVEADGGDIVNDTEQIKPKDIKSEAETVKPKESPMLSKAVIQSDRSISIWGTAAIICVLVVGAFAGVYIRRKR